MHVRLLATALLIAALAPTAAAQWDPENGDWGRIDEDHLRVMTFNIKDGLCSTNDKQEEANQGFNNWHALARIVAAFQPDVLILQETADNSGNGTGGGVDSVADMQTVLDLFLHGGTDPFSSGNPAVTAYVQKYAPGYDLPYRFVSNEHDGFNRNVTLSRWPFADLNGDFVHTYSDIRTVSGHKYAPGGDGGIRGFQFSEIDLPDDLYEGDVVVGNAHLKAGGGGGDEAQRLEAAQNVAYFIDHWYNGEAAGTPDPYDKISDNPKATNILDADTPVIYGGDWNEDESDNGRRGPALWLTAAKIKPTDGVDRDRSEAVYDDAREPISGRKGTVGTRKFDYLAHQDSIAAPSVEAIFDSSRLSSEQYPPEITGFPKPDTISGWASDHLPVIVDYDLPRCASGASWRLYGRGWRGTGNRIPSFAATGDPMVGTSIDLLVENTSGKLQWGVLVSGKPKHRIVTFWGGHILMRPRDYRIVTIPPGGLVLPYSVPDDDALCGTRLYLQFLQSDPGASAGIASTRGMKLLFGR